MTDDEYQELFKAWVSYKYGIPREQIEEVTMSLGTEGPYSPETPDVSAHVSIFIKAPGWTSNRFGNIEHTYEDPTELIKDILSFESENWVSKGRPKRKKARRTA